MRSGAASTPGSGQGSGGFRRVPVQIPGEVAEVPVQVLGKVPESSGADAL